MWVKRRHKIFHKLARRIAYCIFRLKYRFRSKLYKLPKEPHLILFNHVSNLDPVFVGLSFTRPTYFIANEDLFNIPYVSKILNYLVAPIPKQKSVRDSSAIRTSLKIIKEGGNIGVAPEGNRTYSGSLGFIDIAISKFAKLLKVPVVLYSIKGGFGVNPRFSIDIRKGKIFGKVERILTVEEVKTLSNEELLEVIKTTLTVDDSKLDLPYKGKKRAEELESVFYLCPVCQQFHTIYSKGNYFGCGNCGYQVEYTEKLLFESDDDCFKFKTIKEYYQFQIEYLKKYPYQGLTYSDDNIVLVKAFMHQKREKLLKGRLSLNKERLLIDGVDGKREFLLEEIVSLAIVYHNTLIVNLRDEKYHLQGDSKFNALKYLHLYTLIKNETKGEEDEFLGI